MNKNIAVVGATGLVGRTMIKVLEQRQFPLGELRLFASERSAGAELEYKGRKIVVRDIEGADFRNIDIALFSAGGQASKKYAPIVAKQNCVVIDNSSAWRMDPDTPLVVPEVNPHAIKQHKGIIANPNCSTIQMLVPLKVIHDRWKLKRIIVSTYQSISGAGQKGIDKLFSELTDVNNSPGTPMEKIAFNTTFHDIDSPDGFSGEEIKMINETRKILDEPDMKVAVTCVRLPILGGHGESVNIETEKPFDLDEMRLALADSPGIELIDNPMERQYPVPLLSNDTDPVYVGRLRRDTTVDNGAYLWIVADNVRKGAATNAVQIAEKLLEL